MIKSEVLMPQRGFTSSWMSPPGIFSGISAQSEDSHDDRGDFRILLTTILSHEKGYGTRYGLVGQPRSRSRSTNPKSFFNRPNKIPVWIQTPILCPLGLHWAQSITRKRLVWLILSLLTSPRNLLRSIGCRDNSPRLSKETEYAVDKYIGARTLRVHNVV